MAVRCADCTRRQHLKREASETRCAQTADASLSVSGTGDASPSNGDSLQRQRQQQLQRSLRGQGQLQRTHGTIVWQQALDRQYVDRAGSTRPTGAQTPGPPNPASLLVSCWPMIDPADDLTRPLPVASPCPIRMQFAAPDRLHTVVLMQDL